LDNVLSISEIIKRYIKLRGYKIQQVADMLNINYKTFDGILNRDVVDAKLLFQLANLLEIDLCWMAQLYENKKPISFLEQFQMTRMNQEMRDHEMKMVLSCLDRHIVENPASVSEIKTLLLRDFPQLFYLLDVLLPENYTIRVTVERNREKYYCMPIDSQPPASRLGRGRSAIGQIYEGHEMLKQLILDRKEKLTR
jgi:transcriptional regulator with XRE-family HTH domain